MESKYSELDPGDIVRAIAAMHDRAAARTNPQVRLMHEQCAIHLRAISDDPTAIRALLAQTEESELCNYEGTVVSKLTIDKDHGSLDLEIGDDGIWIEVIEKSDDTLSVFFMANKMDAKRVASFLQEWADEK